jgi:hypothetical protein
MRREFGRFLMIGVVAGSVGFSAAVNAVPITVVVSPANMNGWSFGTADPNGNPPGNAGDIGQMVTGPGAPPYGVGSAQLATAPGHGDDASYITTSAYNGTRLSQLTQLSYSTFVTANNGQQFPYVQLSVASSGSGPADDILFFEPPYQTPGTGNPGLPDQGSTALGTWQLWNATVGGWWDFSTFSPGSGVGSLADFLALFPNATIEDNPFAGGGIAITVGYASAGDNFNAYVDGVTIGTLAGGAKTFDFEPGGAQVPESANTFGLFGVAMAALAGYLHVPRGRRAVV